MYKPEGSAVSSAAASSIASDKGVLIAARKSSVAPNVKEHIICGAPVMDSDIPKVLILHVTESRSYLPFRSRAVARKEIENYVRAFAFMEKKEGMGCIRKVTLTSSKLGVHVWIDGCLDPKSCCEY